MNAISELITNAWCIDTEDTTYSAMIGLEPSKGAKSPVLWNACLRGDSRMVCLDVPCAENLHKIMEILIADRRCRGGAVTAPYKRDVFNLLENRTDQADATGVCNSFFRIPGKDTFGADNTDSYGFIRSLTSEVDLDMIDKVVILGNGGVTQAVVEGLRKRLSASKEIAVLTRGNSSWKEGRIRVASYSDYLSTLSGYDSSRTLLVNCTSIGDYTNPGVNLLETVPELSAILALHKISALFDCIHTPEETQFAAGFNCTTINGKGMNLLQAVKGFLNAYPSYSENQVRWIMEGVR